MSHGATAKDRADFGPKALPALRRAAEDLREFLGRGYAMNESLGFVGNHFKLTSRQRQFLFRCVSPPAEAAARRARRIAPAALAGEPVVVDGYNCLIITETCVAGGIVLLSDDGALRDVQGVYGTYRITRQTRTSLELLTAVLAAARPARVEVWLDERMRYAHRVAADWQAMLAAAAIAGTVSTAENADRQLRSQAAHAVLASSDRENIDAAARWVDLPRAVASRDGQVRIVDLSVA